MTITKYNVPAEIEKKILTAIELKKELERYEAEIKVALKDAMIENDIYSIKNDKYTVTLATRATYKEEDQIPFDFQKVALDTKKVGDYEKLYGEVPKGVKKSETKYITWRAK
jgi:hypothetical protein